MVAEGEGQGDNSGDEGEGEGKPPPPDSDPKATVPASDLMAVKGQLIDAKAKLGTAETEAADWQAKFNAKNSEFTTASTELESLKNVQTELDELKAKSEGDSKLLTDASAGLIARTKDVITSRYPDLKADKLKDKTLEQLDIMRDTLEDVAPSGRKNNDPGPGGPSPNGATPLENAAQEMAAAKAR